MHHDVAVLGSIGAIWLAATLVPGPDFLTTTRVALTHSRAVALRTVLGIACGTCLWGLAGFFGIHALFNAAPFLYFCIKIVGGGYLIALGFRLFAGSFRQHAKAARVRRSLSASSAFGIGFVTNLSNPKAAFFTASLFAATLPPAPSLALGLGAAAIMTTIAIGWYSAVVCALTTRRAANAFKHLRHWIDRIAGLALMGFGTRLALER